VLTGDRAEHAPVFSRDGTLYVDSRTAADAWPESVVVREDGRSQVRLPDAAEMPPFRVNLELTTAGPRAFPAAIVRPRDFQPARRYPVVVQVYGGPHALTVKADERQYLLPQWIADQGAIVVCLDNRGTPRRDRAWERAIKGGFGTVPLEDQVEGLKALGAAYPELDLERVGVFGWSFGGYMAALAVLRRPDVFKVGVAGAPVVDWLDYDTHYTERYLDLPDAAPEAYHDSSLLTHAPNLSRPLLVIHGTADDNVYFFHSLKLADALFRAGRPFELCPLAGVTHQVPDPAVRARLWARITDFLLRHLGVD
jgi:dipeptidyl-peptidase-4